MVKGQSTLRHRETAKSVPQDSKTASNNPRNDKNVEKFAVGCWKFVSYGFLACYGAWTLSEVDWLTDPLLYLTFSPNCTFEYVYKPIVYFNFVVSPLSFIT